MKQRQLTIDFQGTTIVAHLEHIKVDDDLLNKLAEIDEKEQGKIIMVVTRIQEKGGSISHFLKYLKIIF